MNILQAAQTHPPEWSGGSTFLTVMLCRKLVESGIRVHYLCGTWIGNIEPYRRIDEEDGPYPLTKIGMGRRTNGENHLRRIREICRAILEERKIDIVHIHSTRGIGEGLILAAQDLGIPVIVRLTDGSWLCTNLFFVNNLTGRLCTGSGPLKCTRCQFARLDRSPPGRKLRDALRYVRNVAWTLERKRRILESADRVVATCNFLIDQFRAFGFDKRLDLIRNRIDETEIVRKPLLEPKNPVRFGSLGSFRPNKGGELLLDAVRKLSASGSGFELHIWGLPDPEIRDRYGETFDTAPVVLHDRYDRTDLNDIFAAIDVLVHTSLWDTLPIVVLEALASGTPVLTSNSHGMKEAVEHGVTGFLFEPGDSDDLARRMKDFIDDPGLVRRMEKAIPPPEPFDGMVSEYMELYTGMLGTAD